MVQRRGVSLRAVVVIAALAGVAAAVFYIVRALTLPLVQVTRIAEGDVVEAFYATGTITPEREYPIRAQVAGTLLLEPEIDKGKSVSKGQLLGRVISEDMEKKLRQSEAELKEKQIRADEKKSPVIAEFDRRLEAFAEILASVRREYDRLMKLAEQGNAQVVEIDRCFERMKSTWSEMEAARAQREAKILELKKDLEVATANHEIAKWNIEQQELRSPVGGVILDWPVPSRTRVAVNDHVMMIADVRPEQMVVRAQVDEEDRAQLYLGQTVRMTLYSFPDGKFEAKVKTIYAKADPQRRTFEVDVEILRPAGAASQPASSQPSTSQPATSQPATAPTASMASAPSPSTQPYDRFAAGMTGELAFIIQERKNCTILPRQALQGESIFVVRDGRIAEIHARTGVKNVTRLEVLGGIGPREQVMISPIGRMELNQAVRVQFVDPRVAADLNQPKDTGVFKGFN